jgi:uncharacterized integral membrane protein
VRFSRRGRNVSENWQPKLWLILVALLLVGGYLFAFAVKNDERVDVDFVLGTTTTSLIWTILLSLVLGLVAGVLLSQLYRRRGRHERRQAGDSLGDRVGVDEAER